MYVYKFLQKQNLLSFNPPSKCKKSCILLVPSRRHYLNLSDSCFSLNVIFNESKELFDPNWPLWMILLLLRLFAWYWLSFKVSYLWIFYALSQLVGRTFSLQEIKVNGVFDQFLNYRDVFLWDMKGRLSVLSREHRIYLLWGICLSFTAVLSIVCIHFHFRDV